MGIAQQFHSFPYLFGNLSSFASKLKPVMLHNRALKNCTAMRLRNSPLERGDVFGKFFELKFRNERASFILTAAHPKVVRSDRIYHPSRSHFVGALSFLKVQPQLNDGLHELILSVRMFNHRSLSVGGPYRGAFAKRSFSQVPKPVTSKNSNTGYGDGRSVRNTSSVKVFNKHWNRAKLLRRGKFSEIGSQGAMSNQIMGENSSNSKISTSEEVVMVKKDVNSSMTKGKQPGTSNAGVHPGVSKTESHAKKNHITNSNKSSLYSQKISSETSPMAVFDGSISIKPAKKKKKKGKSKSKTVSVSSPESVQKSPNVLSDSASPPQEAKPQTSVKPKPHAERASRQLYPPIGKSVLVVESVAKAKIIQGYLGEMFEVLPSFGHVRDLAARSGSVRPNDDFSMVWEVPSAAWTHLKSIKVALRGAENLILASDPDREGEVVAWHIIEMLQQQDALPKDINLARIVFNEITESSIKTALLAPRDINANLVHADLARRALDYLIGFNISPLLWKKLPGCSSAGRVQSAALSLICDRELEIDKFKPQEYWTINVEFNDKGLGSISSYLTQFENQKFSKQSITSLTEANDIQRKIEGLEFEVSGSKRTKTRKNPPTPYLTSTLQQDAANKLHFPAIYTMKLAQKLYEGVQLSDANSAGLITYFKTDGLNISNEVCEDICSLVRERYGQNFATRSARKYFKKVKNAQEAHEAIRPTDIRRFPSNLAGTLDEDSLKLYTLIWSRTMACQMEPAIIDQIQIDIVNSGQSIVLRSASSRTEFLGYQAVYKDEESKAIRSFYDNEMNDRDDIFEVLRNLKTGDPVHLGKVNLKQHHTQPPSRFSEGSLVKNMEELGIGRPSTYATTVKVLQERNYVAIKNRILYPEFRGRMMSAFLSHHFSEVTDYSFTADMETELDNVSAGLTEWKGLLRDYWTRFSEYCERTNKVHIHQVEKMLEKTFGDFLFESVANKSRTCPSCREGTLSFKISKIGASYFIGCNQHPRCKYTAKTLYGDDEDDDAPENKNVEEPKFLGLNPGSDEKILLKSGPYGYYVQLGEDRKGYVPKRASVTQIKDLDSITLEYALKLLSYPVTLGKHPDDGHPVVLKLAASGFAIKHRRRNATVPKNMKPNDISFEKALELLLGKDVRQSGRPKKNKQQEELEVM